MQSLIKMTKRSIIKEIAQFAKIEGLCIATAMVVYFLHIICTILIANKIFEMVPTETYQRVARFFWLGWAIDGITNFLMSIDSLVLFYAYIITTNTLWVGMCFGIVLCLCARLIRHNQITTKKLVLPVIGSAVLMCVCSGVWGLWLLIFRKSMGCVKACGSAHTALYIMAPIIGVVLCILIVVQRSTGRLNFIFRPSNTTEVP